MALAPNPIAIANPIAHNPIQLPIPAPIIRSASRHRSDIEVLLNIMSADDMVQNKVVMGKMIAGSIWHLTPQQKHKLLKIHMAMIRDNNNNPVIAEGCHLDV